MNGIKRYSVCLFICYLVVSLIQQSCAESITYDITEYDSVEPFIMGYACVGKDGLYGLINEEQQLAVPIMFDYIKTFDNWSVYTNLGYCEVGFASNIGVYNIGKRELLIPCKYDAVYYKEIPTGTYFIMQKYPLIEVNYGWWELHQFDIYDTDGHLVYQTTAFYIKEVNGRLEECVLPDENASYDLAKGNVLTEIRAIELPHNSGNSYKASVEPVCESLYSYAKEEALRESHDIVYVYLNEIFYIVVDNDVPCFVDIYGNVLSYTKINSFEYDWEAIRINGKVYSEYIW